MMKVNKKEDFIISSPLFYFYIKIRILIIGCIRSQDIF